MQSSSNRMAILKTSGKRNSDQNAPFPRVSLWLRDHVYLATLIVLIASLVPRLFLTLSANPQDLIFPDSESYFTPTVNLLEHGAFLDRKERPEVSRTPGYPVFLLAIMVITGKGLENYDNLRVVLIVQTIILSWGVVFLYWLARRIVEPVMALTGALLAAFSPWSAVAAGLALTEGLFIFLLSLLFLLIKLVEDSTTLKNALWGSMAVGLLTAAVILVRPLWPFLVFAVGTLVLRFGPRRKGAGLVFSVVLVCATLPLTLWVVRNGQEAHFYGLSDISGKAAWWCLGSRVLAQANASDAKRWDIYEAFRDDEVRLRSNLSVQEADNVRWQRAKTIFREHPFLTLYSFSRNAAEHIVHPSPGLVLTPARLNFQGDYWVLAGIWGGIVALAWVGWRDTSTNHAVRATKVDCEWLRTILVVCLFLTLLSGLSYGGGARFRVPLEVAVPLLAGVGFVRLYCYYEPPSVAQSGAHVS